MQTAADVSEADTSTDSSLDRSSRIDLFFGTYREKQRKIDAYDPGKGKEVHLPYLKICRGLRVAILQSFNDHSHIGRLLLRKEALAQKVRTLARLDLVVFNYSLNLDYNQLFV